MMQHILTNLLVLSTVLNQNAAAVSHFGFYYPDANVASVSQYSTCAFVDNNWVSGGGKVSAIYTPYFCPIFIIVHYLVMQLLKFTWAIEAAAHEGHHASRFSFSSIITDNKASSYNGALLKKKITSPSHIIY